MAIPSNATLIWRITARVIRRGVIPAADLAKVVSAMQSDTTNQYSYLHASGNTIVYDWAPRADLNFDATLSLKKAISWEGLDFRVTDATLLKGL